MVVSEPNAPVPQPVPVVFMGSPAFAVPTLQSLAQDTRFTVRLVVTQPPKPIGRGKQIAYSAVHEAADRLGLTVWTPERLRGMEALTVLREAGATLHIVAAYGKILRRDVLAIPTHGTLNVHASLLPAYRGASPITAVILDGVAQTGVTIMLLDEGLDTGPVLSKTGLDISSKDTITTLTERLATAGAPLLVDTAVRWIAGEITPKLQDATRATVTRTLTKEDGFVDFTQAPEQLARMERAYMPWPGLYTFLGGMRVILRALTPAAAESDAPPGTILAADREGISVATGGGVVRIGAVQPEGKGAMPASAFAAGRPNLVGMRFRTR